MASMLQAVFSASVYVRFEAGAGLLVMGDGAASAVVPRISFFTLTVAFSIEEAPRVRR